MFLWWSVYKSFTLLIWATNFRVLWNLLLLCLGPTHTEWFLEEVAFESRQVIISLESVYLDSPWRWIWSSLMITKSAPLIFQGGSNLLAMYYPAARRRPYLPEWHELQSRGLLGTDITKMHSVLALPENIKCANKCSDGLDVGPRLCSSHALPARGLGSEALTCLLDKSFCRSALVIQFSFRKHWLHCFILWTCFQQNSLCDRAENVPLPLV